VDGAINQLEERRGGVPYRDGIAPRTKPAHYPYRVVDQIPIGNKKMKCQAISILSLLVVTSLSAAEPPAAILDLAAWKLTLPYNTARKGNPDEVVQPELALFQDPNCFFTSPSGDAVIFRASCGGLGTENSSFPRSELREMKASGKDEIGWSTKDATLHVMEIEQAITHVPDVKQHVVCAQIHDKEDDVMMVRLEKQKLFVERNKFDDVPLDSNYKIGDKFTLRIAAGEGRIKVWYNDELKMDWAVEKSQCYFKAGCYTQSNAKKGDKPEAYGEVAIYELKVTHR